MHVALDFYLKRSILHIYILLFISTSIVRTQTDKVGKKKRVFMHQKRTF